MSKNSLKFPRGQWHNDTVKCHCIQVQYSMILHTALLQPNPNIKRVWTHEPGMGCLLWGFGRIQLCYNRTCSVLMPKCKTVVSPLLMHWRYCSLALSHQFLIICSFSGSHHSSWKQSSPRIPTVELPGLPAWEHGAPTACHWPYNLWRDVRDWSALLYKIWKQRWYVYCNWIYSTHVVDNCSEQIYWNTESTQVVLKHLFNHNLETLQLVDFLSKGRQKCPSIPANIMSVNGLATQGASTSEAMVLTVRCRYNNRHLVARPWGRVMGCLLWF